MSGTKILWGQILTVFAIVLVTTWGATEWVAWRLGYQPQLGKQCTAATARLLLWLGAGLILHCSS